MNSYPITAFPTTEANWLNENARTEGMTLRDHFAGLAMQALIRRYDGKAFGGGSQAPEHIDLAEQAYFLADHMLAQRSKP